MSTETDTLFHIIPDHQCILRSKGTFYQRKLYHRHNRLYAAHGGGFIRLGSNDATSNPNISLEALEGIWWRDKMGNPCYEKPKGT